MEDAMYEWINAEAEMNRRSFNNHVLYLLDHPHEEVDYRKFHKFTPIKLDEPPKQLTPAIGIVVDQEPGIQEGVRANDLFDNLQKKEISKHFVDGIADGDKLIEVKKYCKKCSTIRKIKNGKCGFCKEPL